MRSAGNSIALVCSSSLEELQLFLSSQSFCPGQVLTGVLVNLASCDAKAGDKISLVLSGNEHFEKQGTVRVNRPVRFDDGQAFLSLISLPASLKKTAHLTFTLKIPENTPPSYEF